MTDKKLTDSEIVKALEHCGGSNCLCSDCILFRFDDDDCQCSRDLKLNALDLINRQKAEIERLNIVKREYQELYDESQSENKRLKNTLDDVLDREPLLVERSEKYAKAEAYKEFADKLKLHAYHECDITGYRYLVVQIEEIDNLLKELVGEDNEG